MRSAEWRNELKRLINCNGVDTELDAPDWLIMEQIDHFLSTVKMFSTHIGYTPLNTMVIPFKSSNTESPK